VQTCGVGGDPDLDQGIGVREVVVGPRDRAVVEAVAGVGALVERPALRETG